MFNLSRDFLNHAISVHTSISMDSMDNISIIVRIPASTYFFQTNENSQSEILLVSNLLRKIYIRHETFLTEQFDVSYSHAAMSQNFGCFDKSFLH